jgi:predicted ATPase
MDAEDYHFRFKFCFIGDNGVGKSGLLDGKA